MFVAIASIFGSIVTGRYELAIMLPRKDEDAINVMAISFIINVILSFFILLAVVIFHDNIVKLLGSKDISPWLYFVPFSTFLIGAYNSLNYFNNRKKYYKDLAKANVLRATGLSITQLSLGFLKAGAAGLISGQIFSQILANLKLLYNLKGLNMLNKIEKSKLITLLQRYKDFPKFSMWGGLINTLSHRITNILVTSLYNISTLGFYSLAQRVLGMPSVLIGSSISQVYFQQATKEKQKTGKAIKTFKNTSIKLFVVSLPIFGILFFTVEDLFTLVFGEKWRIAGSYTKILAFFYMIRFISGTLSVTVSVFEKQKMTLFINAIILVTVITILFLSHIFRKNFIYFLKLFSGTLSLEYALFFLYYYRLANGGKS